MGVRRTFFPLALIAGLSRVTPAAGQLPPRPSDLRYIALPAVSFHSPNTDETLTLRLYRPDGSLDPRSLGALAHFLRDPATGVDAPVVSRTLQLIVRVAHHFDVTRVIIVSGYRSTRDATGASHRQGHHGDGSAIDFSLPDIPTDEVAAYARTLSYVGVGWYPASHFVHLDSRDRSYAWINHAGPGDTGEDVPLPTALDRRRETPWTASMDLPWETTPAGTPLPRLSLTARLHRRLLHNRRRHLRAR